MFETNKKLSGTEYEINKAVQRKSGLLDDLHNENKQYELKRIVLEKDLADVEICEIIIR